MSAERRGRGPRTLRRGVLLLWVLGACGGEPAPGGLQLRPGATLDLQQAAACDPSADGPQCPSGLSCAVIALAEGAVGPVCIEGGICSQLTCSQGQCAILETHPAQVVCVN